MTNYWKRCRSLVPWACRLISSRILALACALTFVTLTSAPSAAQSWLDNFESYPLGSFPSANWTPSGNNGTSIVNSTSTSPTQSVQMFGVVGGCWAALMHRPLSVSPPYTIQLYARNGNETINGCHAIRASVQLNSGPSWTYPGRLLGTFGSNGDFLTNWPTVTTGPAYPLLNWVKVQITYELPDSKHVRMRYWINGKYYRTVTTTQSSSETQFSWLALESGEGTSWFDDVSVTSGLPTLTTTILTSTPNPSNLGQAVTFTAKVTSKSGTPPDGETLYFMKGNKVLGTGTLSAGTATFTTSAFKTGTTTIKAVYLSDSTFPNNGFAGSNSNTVTQVVQ